MSHEHIGRVVQVRGPVEFSRGFDGLPAWLIRPVTPAPFAVEYRRRGLRIERVYWRSRAEHPDAWLWPIGPELEEIGVQNLEIENICAETVAALSRAALHTAAIAR